MKPNKSHNCCDKCYPFKALYIGVLYLIAILALVFAIWSWSNSSFVYSWIAVTASQNYPMNYGSTLITSPTPIILTMPSILTSWVGQVYYVECLSPLTHSVRITVGGYTWDGVNTVVTCDLGTSSAGFSFHVTSQTTIRVLNANHVTFR